MTRSFPIRFLACISLLIIVGFSACKKIKEPDTSNTSYVRFINVSPTLGTYNIYFDDKIANSAPIPFGGSLAYAGALAGDHTVKYTTASNTQVLFTKPINLLGNKVHSLYLLDRPDKLDALLVTDEAPAAVASKAYVKFINLSQDAPALSLNVKDGLSIATGKTYKTSSEFVLIDAKTYTFEVKDAAGGVKTTLADLEIVAGRYYTIISRGLLTPGLNEQSFSAQSIVNF